MREDPTLGVPRGADGLSRLSFDPSALDKNSLSTENGFLLIPHHYTQSSVFNLFFKVLSKIKPIFFLEN